MIGICGIAMGTLAAMLREQGHSVSGSDRNVYPPMSDILRNSGIGLHDGFSADHIGNPDLVIIGNAISRGNPEVERVLDGRIPYLSMAGALHKYFLRGREVIAVAGTHGKSTTTALLAHILESAGESPSFFVGGVLGNYGVNYRIGKGRHFIIEGDEYDSAFFEKVPKFIFYRPGSLVLTSLEFDHADIYRDLDEIELWFRRLVNIIPSGGSVCYSNEYGNLREIAATAFSKKISYGPGGDYRVRFRGYSDDFSLLDIETPRGGYGVRTRLFGEYNYANIIAAISMADSLGVGGEAVRAGVESFTGVRRRQELIYRKGGVRIYEDFAHHPTAVRFALAAVRERHPGARVWAVYEPRSATSRRDVFQDVLPGSFRGADIVLIKTPYTGAAIAEGHRLDPNRLIDDIRAFNENAYLLPGVDDILDRIASAFDPGGDNVFVIMSNGGFDGIYDKIKIMMDKLTG